MTSRLNPGVIAASAALILVTMGATSLMAEGLAVPPMSDPTAKKECGACHMLYPPALLPARSWRAITGDLANHFGDNAELDAATTKALTDYLVANAGDARGGGSKIMRGLDPAVTPERITDLPWWRRKHEKRDRVAPATLARKGAKFKGDCKACHTGAEKGYFEDD
jgi:hypothetical protein